MQTLELNRATYRDSVKLLAQPLDAVLPGIRALRSDAGRVARAVLDEPERIGPGTVLFHITLDEMDAIKSALDEAAAEVLRRLPQGNGPLELMDRLLATQDHVLLRRHVGEMWDRLDDDDKAALRRRS